MFIIGDFLEQNFDSQRATLSVAQKCGAHMSPWILHDIPLTSSSEINLHDFLEKSQLFVGRFSPNFAVKKEKKKKRSGPADGNMEQMGVWAKWLWNWEEIAYFSWKFHGIPRKNVGFQIFSDRILHFDFRCEAMCKYWTVLEFPVCR